jgi:hypothetical protein
MQSDVLLCSVRSRLVWKFLVCISVKSSAVIFSEGRCFSTIFPFVVCTKVGKLPMHAWLSTLRPWNKGFQESSLLLKEI